MGYEIECDAVIDGTPDHGRALLETDHVLFRGAGRLKMAFSAIASVACDGDSLIVDASDHSLTLKLGAQAARWADRMRNPKSLLDKLGVRSGMAIALIGVSDTKFAGNLRESGCEIVASPGDASVVFVQVDGADGLRVVPDLAENRAPGGAIWIIAPKGCRVINDRMVIQAGRDCGLVDTKVCAFSATHTALKFVRRRQPDPTPS